RSACSVQCAPSDPSHALACSTFAMVNIVTPAGHILPLGVTYAPKGRMSIGNGIGAHHHVVRHSRPARGEAVDDLRARPADGPSPRTLLAACGEQDLRGAQEAG